MSLVAVLPRGINLGARNKVSMPVLRTALAEAGFSGVQTYVASGNIVVEAGDREPADVAAQVRALVAERFGVDVLHVPRTREELDATVEADPLGSLPGVAEDPARHAVVFLADHPDLAALAAVDAEALLPERFAVVGRDLHTWHPAGLQSSRLDQQLGRTGAVGTARNWRTVLRLQQMLTVG